MIPTKEITAYWNENTDPLNWCHIRDEDLPSAWRKAVSTYLSPEICHAISSMGALHGKRILLLGAGLGQGTVLLARMGANVIGLDLANSRCLLAKKMLSGKPEERKVSFIVANAMSLPFPNGYFHFILDQDVLMYANPFEIARECKRVLAPGGKAVFVESTDGHPIIKLFRKACYGKNMRMFTHHLRYSDMKRLSTPGLRLDGIKGFYFLSIISFAMLYFFRSVSWYQWSLSVLYPIDRIVLKIFPGLSRFTWKVAAVYGATAMPVLRKVVKIRENLT